MYDLIFYKRSNGRKPVLEFIESLGKKNPSLVAKILSGFKLLEKYGPGVSMPHVRYMADGIYELRCKAENGISRVFFFFWDGQKIVFTNGFVKKTQKTPKQEIEKAFCYKQDYEANHE